MIKKVFLISLALALIGLNVSAQEMVKDIKPGYYGSSPRNFVTVNNIMYFVADSTASGNSPMLWKTDGTNAGTSRVSEKKLWKGGIYDGMANLNGKLYFGAFDPTLGFELHKTDGTEAGTVIVKDIMANNNPGFYGSHPANIIEFDGNLYFSADDGINGRELWKSDGTEAGTVMVKDIRPGQYGSIDQSYFTNFAIVNHMLYFAAWDGGQAFSHELWKSDGTEAGTVRVKISSDGKFGKYPRNLAELNGNLYYSASSADMNNNNTSGTELYKSDGTDEGTVMLKDIYPGDYQSSYPQNFKSAGSNMFFTANDGTYGEELWATDGTESGTRMVKDIRVGNIGAITTTGGSETGFMSFNNNLYFPAYESEHGTELWKSDGTPNGTIMVKDIYSGTANSDPKAFCVVNGKLYFSGGDLYDQKVGIELWKTDGTSSGTSMVKDICPGKYGSIPYFLYNYNGILFFSASDGLNGTELWKYDESTGINETKFSNSALNIYPNPSNDIITIHSASNNINEKFNIYNSLGEKILSGIITGKTTIVVIKHLQSGIYLLQVNDQNQQTFKLVKNK